MPASASRRLQGLLVPIAFVVVSTGILLLLFPLGFLNYDTAYALVWGRELAGFQAPSQSAPLAPTPHPLIEILAAIVSPLGDGAAGFFVVLAYLALGLIAYFVFRLGQLWFDRWVGLAAAVIVLTRAPFLSNGLRAYIDLPYIALCLAALAVETQRPRAGWPVLTLLALAGLIRPEAWLFSIVYLGYLLLDFDRNRESRLLSPQSWKVTRRPGVDRPALLAALALAGPVLWAAFDLITTGSPTYSFTGTRETVESLERETGPVDLVLYGPRRLGEVLQWPGMIGAAAGIVFGLILFRRKVTIGLVGAGLALLAFAILACAGLAILPRYTMLAAAILVVFAAAALLGWRLVGADNPWRRRWQVTAAAIALMFFVWIPNQYDLLSQVDEDLSAQSEIEDDLNALVTDAAFGPLCLPVSGPNHRAVPRLSFWLDIDPYDVVNTSEEAPASSGYFIAPRNQYVIDNFVFDPTADDKRLDVTPPPGFERVPVSNDSWVAYRLCTPG